MLRFKLIHLKNGLLALSQIQFQPYYPTVHILHAFHIFYLLVLYVYAICRSETHNQLYFVNYNFKSSHAYLTT